MAVIKQKLLKADEVQADGSVYSGEDLRHMAKSDIRFRYEPEDQTLYMFMETGDTCS